MADPQNDVLDRFFATMRDGDFEGWRSLLSAKMQQELEENLPTEESRQEFMAHQRTQAPDRFEVVDRETREGIVALVVVTVSATDDGEERQRIIAEFVEEDGEWRVDELALAADPIGDETAEIEQAADDERGEIDDYNLNSHTSMGGPVVRVSFGEEWGLLVVRVLHSEQSVFLPTRQAVADSGVDPELLVPDAIVEIEGHPHGTDPCKVLATRLTVRK